MLRMNAHVCLTVTLLWDVEWIRRDLMDPGPGGQFAFKKISSD